MLTASMVCEMYAPMQPSNRFRHAGEQTSAVEATEKISTHEMANA
jgi:hypothetical protein